MNMTTRQKIAIRRPCFLATETMEPGFGWRALDQTVSIMLTVNVGME